jgi:3-phosphoshikimate 1-carboxyvinyltransferase
MPSGGPAGEPILSLTVHRSGGPLRGSARLVGDKSISHRALLLGALADGITRIDNLSPCADVRQTIDCLARLGVVIERMDRDPAALVDRADRAVWGAGETAGDRPAVAGDSTGFIVHGRGVRGLTGPPVVLDCGDSGTTMRLLAGALAGQARAFTLDGAPGLRRRPMARVADPLSAMGAEIRTTGGYPPLVGEGRAGLRALDYALPQASAQVGSAVLLAGLNAAGLTRVHYPAPVRDHTERMLAAMGAPIDWDGATTTLDGPVGSLTPVSDPSGWFRLPNDPSAAAFLLAAAAIVPGSDIQLVRVGLNPGRRGFLDILAAMGAEIRMENQTEVAGEPVADLRLTAAPLRATEVAGALIARSIDELALVAVLATQAAGRTVVRDAGELRVKESDRIAAIADGLARLGARIEALPDGFAVDGPTVLRGAAVDGYADHRIVMALVVAGLVADGETRVSDAQRVGDSFPGFGEGLGALGAYLEPLG